MGTLCVERNDFCGWIWKHGIKKEKGREDQYVLVNVCSFSFKENWAPNNFPHTTPLLHFEN